MEGVGLVRRASVDNASRWVFLHCYSERAWRSGQGVVGVAVLLQRMAVQSKHTCLGRQDHTILDGSGVRLRR